METASLTSVLGHTWFGAGLPETARAALAGTASVAELVPGSVVVREGRPCDAMGIVLNGRMAIRLGLPPYQERTILTVERGDVFGWSAALPGSPATSTCVALTAARAILFEAVALQGALATDAELAAAVYRQLLSSVARRLAATRLQLLDLFGSTVEPW
jgi:CRP-like cAMP-binding protein